MIAIASRLASSEVRCSRTERPFLQIVAAVDRERTESVGGSDFVTLVADFLRTPRGRKRSLCPLDSVLAELGHSQIQSRPLGLIFGAVLVSIIHPSDGRALSSTAICRA